MCTSIVNSWKHHIKPDRKFVLSIIQSGGYAYYAFSSVSESLKEDREFVMEALKANANIYEYIPGAFKAEKEIVLAYVSNAKFFPFGSILEDIPQEFQTDKVSAFNLWKCLNFKFQIIILRSDVFNHFVCTFVNFSKL